MKKLTSRSGRDIAFILTQLVWIVALVVVGFSESDDKTLILVFILIMMRLSSLEDTIQEIGNKVA